MTNIPITPPSSPNPKPSNIPDLDSGNLDELREKLEKEVLNWMKDYKIQLSIDELHALLYGATPKILEHSSQYTQQETLKARVNELDNLPKVGFIGSNGIRYEATLFTQIDNRVAELKAQLKSEYEKRS